MIEIIKGNKKLIIDVRNGFILIYEYSLTKNGNWFKGDHILIPNDLIPELTSIMLESLTRLEDN